MKDGFEMNDEELGNSFSDKKSGEYKQEVVDRWGEEALRETEDRIKNWTPEDRERIEQEGKDIISGIVAIMDGGPESKDAQALISRYYDYICNFYDYTLEIFECLGEGYVEDERFAAYFRKFHQELPEFMRDAIKVYVEGLQRSG
ncbi:MAG: TipAS antibiotic-recognition domain-containing protein [Actinobacteria bacterium]|nr:TipAS antibiotic-recognition domain-containing protein [Actinomycetota bacterium]